MGMIDCSKPIVSSMRGVAVGQGLVMGLMADISLQQKTAGLSTATPRLALRQAIILRLSGPSSVVWQKQNTTC